jgi:hypothetical protein
MLKANHPHSEKLDLRLIAVTCAGMALLTLAGIAYPRGDFVLVVGKPGITEAAMMNVISAAGGSFVSGGRYDWLVVAHAESDGFASRLMRSGALLVLDHSLAAGCTQGN